MTLPAPEPAAGPDDGVLSPLPDELPEAEAPEDELPADRLADDDRCGPAEPVAAAADVPPGRLAARPAVAMMLAAVAPAATVRIRARPRSLAAGEAAWLVWFLLMPASLAAAGPAGLSGSSVPAMNAALADHGPPENQVLMTGTAGYARRSCVPCPLLIPARLTGGLPAAT